jgi:GTP-binding protein
MKIKTAEFEQSAPDLKACPKSGRPEFAFIGRSNVGKSSLINMLTAKRDLARASDAPGKTKLINFFLINQAWYLVDLPGYGYAKAGHKEREEFNRAVADYLEKRRNLSCVFVLIDSRLPPQEIDLEFLQWLADCPPPFALVFTKIDKQSASQAQAKIDAYKQFLAGAWEELPPILATSATTRAGRSELLQFISERLEEKQ